MVRRGSVRIRGRSQPSPPVDGANPYIADSATVIHRFAALGGAFGNLLEGSRRPTQSLVSCYSFLRRCVSRRGGVPPSLGFHTWPVRSRGWFGSWHRICVAFSLTADGG